MCWLTHRHQCRSFLLHDDVIKWKHFPCQWPFVQGIHRSPVNIRHKDQWRGALMFSLIYAWTNDWVNNRDAGDFRHHRAHYDVTVMYTMNVIREHASHDIFPFKNISTGYSSISQLGILHTTLTIYRWPWYFDPGWVHCQHFHIRMQGREDWVMTAWISIFWIELN